MYNQFAKGFLLAVMIPTLTVPTQLNAKYLVDGKTKSVQIQTYVSNKTNQSSVVATNGAKLTMYRCTFKKKGKTTNLDDSNQSGLNSVLCANLGSSVKLTRGMLISDAQGANAIVSTGVKSLVNASGVKINTSGDYSRGLYASNGGIIYANKTDITTQGVHCSPLAVEQSGGTIRLSDGNLYSKGKDSPCIYSKGNVIVKKVIGTAVASEAAVIEGNNTIALYNSRLTGRDGIMLYQSTPKGDSVGTSIFTAKNSSIKATSEGPMFYVSNTDAKVELTNTKLIYSSGILINAEANNAVHWGTKNANGGNLTLRATNQIIKGSVNCDSLSTVVLRLADGTTYQGCTDVANTGDVSVVLSKKAKWILTADCYVSGITDFDYELSNIQSLGYNIYYDAKNPANSWLKGTTTELLGGGKLIPMN